MWGIYILIVSVSCCISLPFFCLSFGNKEKTEDPFTNEQHWQPKFSSTHVEQKFSPINHEETTQQFSDEEVEVKISNPPSPLPPPPSPDEIQTGVNWSPVFDADEDYEYIV